MNVHLDTLESPAKRTSTTVSLLLAIEASASMVTTPLHANAVPDTQAIDARHRSTNASQTPANTVAIAKIRSVAIGVAVLRALRVRTAR